VARSSPEDLRTKVRLCGPLALKIDGRDALADLPAGQARSLLAYLLTRGERSAELRCLLRDELGVGPAAELQALHQRLLAGKSGAAPKVADRPVRQPVRRVMPAAVAAAPTRYARNGEISLAYQVLGDGPTTLLLVTGWVLPMEAIWEDPAYARFVERLASSFRVILWDKRGTGLSDRVAVDRLPTLEERMDDIRAVLDAGGAERAAVVGMSEGSLLSALFAAAHPERTESLVLYGGWGATIGDESYRTMPRRARFDEFADDVQRSWDDMGSFLSLWAPTHEHDPVMRDWWTRALHRGASPASAVAWLRMISAFDIRGVVGAIHTPTLVLHRSGDRMIAVENGRWLACSIPGAEYVELPGDDHLWWLGDQDALLDELERFLVGRAARTRARSRPRDGALHRHRRLDAARRRARRPPLARPHGAPRGDRARPARALPRAGDQDARGRVHVDVRRARAGDPLCRRDP
jgi:pimeloyl-ACP methyl ester carboxylesterase